MRYSSVSLNEILCKVRENWFVLLLFASSTSFFLYQHSTGVLWDFVSYSLNARHFFGSAQYFEWLRPPLAPFIIGIFGFLGWTVAEYAYIIFVSVLFFYAAREFSSAFRMDNGLIYAILLCPFVLAFGTIAGTELLSLSMIMLFAASIAKNKPMGGAFLSLAILARYQNVLFLPLMLLYRKPKKIAFSLAFFLVPLVPWLYYNYLETGSIFTSIADAYAVNISYRYGMHMPFSAQSLIVALNYLLPASIIGLALKIKKIDAGDIFHLAIAAGTIYFFWTVHIKDVRYLFNLLLPAAYFAYFAAKSRPESKYIFAVLSAATVIAAGAIYPQQIFLESGEKYMDALEHLDGCAVLSNGWVFMNYYGTPSEGAPWERGLEDKLSRGYRAVFFRDIPEPEYVKNPSFPGKYPIIYETEEYVILADKGVCAPETERLDKTFLELNSPASAPCKVLFPRLHDSLCAGLK